MGFESKLEQMQKSAVNRKKETYQSKRQPLIKNEELRSVKTSITIRKFILEAVKEEAFQKNSTVSKYIEDLLIEYLNLTLPQNK